MGTTSLPANQTVSRIDSEMTRVLLVLSLLTVAASGHPLNSDYQYPVYPMVPNFLFFRSIDVADVSDAFPDVFWVQAPTNGAFGASLHLWLSAPFSNQILLFL